MQNNIFGSYNVNRKQCQCIQNKMNVTNQKTKLVNEKLNKKKLLLPIIIIKV